MKKGNNEAMAMAVKDVENGVSVRKAAEKYSVPKSTFSDRLTGRVKAGKSWGNESQLCMEDEKQLIGIATERDEMGIGFTKSTFLRFVGVFAKEKGKPFRKETPSDMLWRRLKQRHQSFSLRCAEATAVNRHNAMTKERISMYFQEMKSIFDKYDFHHSPNRIWNMDETGITMCHKLPKVIASKGAKTVHGKASLSRETLTVIACGSASGQKIAPHFIIHGKTPKKLHGFDTNSCLADGSPLYDAQFSVSDSGWTKDGICKLWFEKTFLPNIGDDRPQILICDGHRSHNNVELLTLAKQNDIILGELPSHTSHWTQPFDRSVFKALKTSWSVHVDRFITEAGVPHAHANFLRIFGKAWESSITKSNITNGFRATGIYPFDPNAIPDSAYKPAGELTDYNVDSHVALPVSSSSNAADTTQTVPTDATNVVHVDPSNVTQIDPSNVTQTDLSNVTQTTTTHVTQIVLTDMGTQSDSLMTSVCSYESDLNVSMDNVLSIELSIPLSASENVIDLPISVDRFGNLMSVESSPPQPHWGYVSDIKALEIIESTLTSAQIAKYCAALLSDIELEDKVFQTWEMYKQKSSTPSKVSAKKIANDMFPLPKPINAFQIKRKSHSSNGFFAITADELYNEKIAQSEEKKRKIIEKEQRKIAREKQKSLKQNMPKKAQKAKIPKELDANI